MFLLSHHPPEELHRCYRFGQVAVCARCLGTYPTMAAAIALQLALRWPLAHPWDVPLGLALVLPATVDWAVGRWQPHRFSNLWRSATGVLLGLGLGRSLYVHFARSFPAVLVAQAALVTTLAVPVILTAFWRRRSR